jgi:hypothetical protein
MRATARLWTVVCALLAATVATSAAEAKITPIPRPSHAAEKPGALPGTSLIAPESRPVSHVSSKPARRRAVARTHATRTHIARTHATRAHRRVLRTTTTHRRRHAFVPAKSRGGRVRSWHVVSLGGRVRPALPPLLPTPLALVGVGEALPADDAVWPAWKIAALALLGFSETFVLVRLVRNGGLVGAAELT